MVTVTRGGVRVRGGLAVAAMVASLGCSAEFGGRCTSVAECGASEVCLQGYCLPPEAQGPDDGVADDMAPGDDGGRDDAAPVDGGRDDLGPATADLGAPDPEPEPTPDAGSPGELCARVGGVIPAYDPAFGHRACPDVHTLALWRFDTDFRALGPDGGRGPDMEGMPDRDAVQLVAPGIGAQSARFVGQDRDPHFLLAGNNRLVERGPFTVELWVLIEGFQGPDRSLAGNIDVTGRGHGGWELFVRAVEGQGYVFVAGAPAAGDDNTIDLVADDIVVAAGGWHHVALTVGADFRNDQVRLYVDGVASARMSGVLLGGGEAFRLGSRRETTTHFFQGRLDEVRVSGRVRDAEDLRQAAMHPPP